MKNILITWLPKSWKSTLLNKIINEIVDKKWFITNEILNSLWNRIWFEMITNSWLKNTLSHIDFISELKVSKYWVNINNIDWILKDISEFNKNDLLYIDEIWEMELFSEKFKDLVLKFLNSDNIFIWTLSKVYINDFIEMIKKRNDVVILELYENNRNTIKLEINKYLNKKLCKIQH
jgi:nucleoside-triphosphatase THEP1